MPFSTPLFPPSVMANIPSLTNAELLALFDTPKKCRTALRIIFITHRFVEHDYYDGGIHNPHHDRMVELVREACTEGEQQ